MKLAWSHTVLNIKDKEKILDFYINTLGFKVSDSGPIFENGPEIIFISYDPDEHHQLAFVLGREDIGTPTALNHISFRVETYSELKEFKKKFDAINHEYMPLCHGNALSFYFNDPENNGMEIFLDTPWDVEQPQGEPWNPELDEKDALKWVENTFKDKPGFVLKEESTKEFVNR
ncbi:MAG: VOC family protein [Pseudomonadota bacterium]|nr:VOC family protein [Pseudomonadota bacterium]